MIRTPIRSLSRPLLRALPVLLLTAALVAPGAARAELAKWNQERVTGISKDLAQSIKELRKALRHQPPPTLGQPGRVSYYELLDTLGSLESASRRLQNGLAAGKGREETYPTYRRLMSGVRDARDLMKRLEMGESVLSKVQPAADALRRLRPYYEEMPQSGEDE